MSRFSEWKKIDLHIHSIMSSKVKDNDYDGEEFDADKLLDTLTDADNSVNIFSITDHNCINVDLYRELETKITKDKYKDKINYIIGVELDIFDENVYSEVFHCLCFFDSMDIDVIDKSVTELFDNCELKERNKKEVYPNVAKVFSTFASNRINDILLIPHYNNKTKGLKSDIAIENLNYLCFNAYEDSNNIKNIQKSLDIYLKNGFDNFPFAVFTDNHNLSIYPKDKNGNLNEISCYILGNIEFPFNSIKTAFQEARMRISLTGIEGMRSTAYPDKYLKKIFINDNPYELSPYQNTIVGKFGSGKSLFLEKIKHGKDFLKGHERYSEFYNDKETFKLVISNQQINSLDELTDTISRFSVYQFVQQEKYYYKNSFKLEEARQLFNQVNIEHQFNEDISFNFNSQDVKSSYSSVKEHILKTNGKNNLNYGRAFDTKDYYSFTLSFEDFDCKESIEILAAINETFESLPKIKLGNIAIFTQDEMDKIEDVQNLILRKIELIKSIQNLDIVANIQEILKNYNDEYINNNSKNVKDILLEELKHFYTDVEDLASKCDFFESVFNVDVYNKYISEKRDTIIGNYEISWIYKPDQDFRDVLKIIKDANRKSNFFKSILKTLVSEDKQFDRNQEFDVLIDKHTTAANSLFVSKNIQYDILKNGESLLKKSAGEKSSMFIEFIFDLLQDDLDNKSNVLLILDQPEDNIDNDNIYNQIAHRIKMLKLKYENFQCLIVTHNANVAISADSENIIVANESINSEGIKSFSYDSGCIENREFIDNVCGILEGGKKAMERRTIKYGINIIRKVEENEV